jgi:lipopolysaccharide export system protein LptC
MLSFQRFWRRWAALGWAVLLAWTASGCRPDRNRTGVVESVAPELKLEGVRFRVWRGAGLRVQGEAAQVTLRRDSSEIAAHDITALLPRAEPVHLTAREGTGVLQSHAFEAHGGVTMTRGQDVARTDHARYAPMPDGGATVNGDAPVQLDGPAYRLTGQGFTLDPESGDLTLGAPSRLVMRPEAAK